MNNWDEAKLVEVINKKHGEQEKVKPKTAIVSPEDSVFCLVLYGIMIVVLVEFD